MTAAPTGNIAASVHSRLLAIARQSGEPFQGVLTAYGNERLLARIAASSHATSFILKGATLFALWTRRPHRPTRDVDLLGYGINTPAEIAKVFAAIWQVGEMNDGLVFLADSIKAARIRKGQNDTGVRVSVLAMLGKARLPLQVDIGYGDSVFPAPAVLEMPSLLNLPAGSWRTYPKEAVVAEKFHAMVTLGMANSRMKDFFDLWVLQRDFAFDGQVLGEAIRRTFARRTTPLPETLPVALTAEFSSDRTKVTQWRAFLSKSTLTGPDLPRAVALLELFLWPVVAVKSKVEETMSWHPGGAVAGRRDHRNTSRIFMMR